jgi:hypothetical protein
MTGEVSFSFQEGLAEFYRGEVIGETSYSALLEATEDPLERLKLAHLLQLETETKAWLRPHMIRVGMCVSEPLKWREEARQFVAGLVSLGWPDKMRVLASFIPDAVKQYATYAEAARNRGDTDQAAICDFMVDHELAQEEFARLELEGAEPAVSLKPITRQSRYPLPFAP